jgi:hypothetical protein
MTVFKTSLAVFGIVGMSALPIAAQELEATASSGNKEVVSSQGTGAEATAGMAGGLGTAAAVGGGALLLVVALSGDSSSSTSSTSGKN